MKTKEFTSMFVMMLIVCIPFYVADVYAASIDITRYSGEDEVDGFIRRNDRVYLEAIANIDQDEEITPEQLIINNKLEFDECVSHGLGEYRCSFEEEEEYYRYDDNVSIGIRLIDGEGAEVADSSVSVIVDGSGPAIENIVSQQEKQNISLEFDVIDSSSVEEVCSGISKIEFWDSNTLMDSIQPDGDVCDYAVSIELSLPSSERVDIKAYDKLGNVGSDVAPLEIDSTAPSIDTKSFKIMKDGAEIKDFIRQESFEAEVYILIREEELDGSMVIGNFSSAGGSTNMHPGCKQWQSGKTYACTWTGVTIDPVSDSVQIEIAAEDKFGNKEVAEIIRSFQLDNTGPEVTAIYTSLSDTDPAYIGNEPINITMEIEEQGAGLEKENVFLDLSEFGSSKKNPDKCYEENYGLRCVWDGISTSKTSGTLAAYPSGIKDNLGNVFSGKGSKLFIVDDKTPSVNNISIWCVEGATKYEYCKSDDSIDITANISDDSPITAYADLSEIKNDKNLSSLAGECDNSGNYTYCTWNANDIASGLGTEKDIEFKFIDAAGNVLEHTESKTIYGINNESDPDYWTAGTVSFSPPAIDRQVTEYHKQRMYYHIPLEASSSVYPMAVDFAECTGNIEYVEGQNEGIEIFNNERPDVEDYSGNMDPYLIVNLISFESSDVNELNLNCTLNIVSLFNNRVTNIERENINLRIPMFNNPGEASQEINDEIEDIKKKWVEGFGKIIGIMDKIFYYADLICRILGVIDKVRNLWNMIKATTDDTAKVIEVQPGGKPVADALTISTCLSKKTVDKTTESWFSENNKFCNFINCRCDKGTPAGKQGILCKWQAGGKKVLNTMGGGLAEEWTGKEISSYMDHKNNFLVALLMACIPGIIGGLEKYRQIQCEYAYCLQTGHEIGATNIDCSQVKEMATCQFITGEIFQVFPLTALFNSYLQRYMEALSSPMALLGLVSSLPCAVYCANAETADKPFMICSIPKMIAMTGKIWGEIEQIKDKDTWKVPNDYCSKIE
ncbi:hypothetical protein GF336_01760 [Candidatus Woesearchaeota archaeon]|nr:hypothetical protein [Candidatus Woesearchaeota archaeon]